jgi:hypothetical protein
MFFKLLETYFQAEIVRVKSNGVMIGLNKKTIGTESTGLMNFDMGIDI